MKKTALGSLLMLLIWGTLACAAGVPQRLRTVSPEKIGWKEVGRFSVVLQEPTAIVIGAKGDLYLAGKRAIQILTPKGKRRRTIQLEFDPSSLAVDENGAIFAASKDRLWRIGAREGGSDGKNFVKSEPIKGAVLTAIVATEDHLFIADAGNRRVWRFMRPFHGGKPESFTGKLAGKLTEPRFIVPSPYFDMAVGADGLLRIVDPGRHRIKHYTEEGRHEEPLDWGRAGFKLDEFPTCCNPAHIALLSDGAVVTVEKKIPRVKVYEFDGKLRSVVVDPKGLIGKRDFDTLAPRLVVDVAVGPNDEIYLLDPIAKEVRQFQQVR